MSGRYTYEVTRRERGDFTSPGGPPEIVYKGPNQGDALEAAHSAASTGGVVNIHVAVEPLRTRAT